MIRIANICCSRCKRSIAEIRVEVEQEEKQDWLVPQIAEMKQFLAYHLFIVRSVLKRRQTMIKEIGCTKCPYAGHIELKECPDAYTEVSQYCGFYKHEPIEQKGGRRDNE